MKFLTPLILFTFLISACKTDQSSETQDPAVVPSHITSKDPAIKNTMMLLEGTWNSRNDKDISITFKGNTRQESRNGEALGKMRYFEIADQCNNDAPTGDRKVKAKAKYISLLDIDICYYIKKLNKRELILTYVGRKEDLRYIKDTKSAN